MSRAKHTMKKADGGAVDKKVPNSEPVNSMVKREMEGRKRGGKVSGAAAKHRLDKRARGGRMTPKSPLSGAGDMKRMPYEGTMDHQDEGGKGPTVRP